MSEYRYKQLMKDLELNRKMANRAIEYEKTCQEGNERYIKELEKEIENLKGEIYRLELENQNLKRKK